MQFNKAQIVIIVVLVAMVAFLVYLNFKTPEGQIANNKTELNINSEFNLQTYLSAINDSINDDRRTLLNNLLNTLQSDTSDINHKINLAKTYDTLGFSLASGYYYNLIAAKLNDSKSWYKAGFKFYESAATTTDSSMLLYATNGAINAFEKVLMLDANNVEAKNALAICYVQNDLDIMKGVQLLKDVIRIDSNNVDANYTLGILSMRSGQMEKALEKFEKLIRIQPLNPEFYYYLGECFVAVGKKNEGIAAFETFKQLVTDTEVKKNIELTISNLKNQK